MTPRLSLHSARAGYGKSPDVLFDLDLHLPPGRIVALLGENGAGKSTLLKLLAGLLTPRKGEVLLEGRPLASVPRREVARRVAWLPQSFEPLFPVTAFDLVLLGRTPWLGAFSAAGAADRQAARRALEEMDASSLAGQDLSEMSGGERQRVLLARVLATGADTLLLDEPTANLDPRHRFLVVEVLRRCASKGATVVLSSHELEVAAAAADDAALLSAGRLVAFGPVAETLTAPLLSGLFRVAASVSGGPDGRPRISLAGQG